MARPALTSGFNPPYRAHTEAAPAPSHTAAVSAPGAPQVITWLYTSNLLKASAFLSDAVGLAEVFDGGAQQWAGCKVHAAPSSSTWFLGVCDIRPPPSSMDEAALTVTLVASGGREGVDEWHTHLAGSANVNVTAPGHSARFNCYAFNFYDLDAESLGNYRFEVCS